MTELKEENEKLRKLVYEKLGRAEAIALVEERMESPSNMFLTHLKKPSNRILDDETVSFLKNLQKQVPSVKSKEEPYTGSDETLSVVG